MVRFHVEKIEADRADLERLARTPWPAASFGSRHLATRRNRAGALIENVQVSAITEHAASTPARYFVDHSEPLKVGKRRIDRGGCKFGALHHHGRRSVRIFLE
jgi:hypothetical protein